MNTKKNEKDVRIPVDSPAGNAITAVFNSVGPGQSCFYCYPVTIKQKKRLARSGLGEVMFLANKPIGVSNLQYVQGGSNQAWFQEHVRPRVPTSLHHHACQRFRRQHGGDTGVFASLIGCRFLSLPDPW